MDFIKIGYDSVKISLCKEEAKRLSLSVDCDFESEEVKMSFSHLLKSAKEQVGFCYAGGKIVAEMFTSKDGGCEIFISKMEECLYKEKVQPKNDKKLSHTNYVYEIDDLEELIFVSGRLKEGNYIGKSSLYRRDDSKKYLILLEDVSFKDIRYSYLTGNLRINSVIAPAYLKEHCKCIIKKDAVDMLSSLR